MKNNNNWNVLIYMVGGNNLSIDMAYALEELQKKAMIKDSDNLRLFVNYVNNSPEIPPIFCNFSDAEYPTYIYSNQISNKFSEKENSKNSISDAVNPLIDFVDWSVNQTKYKNNVKKENEKYVLILAGHTMGFLSHGLLTDESNNASMNMTDLHNGLEIVKNKIIKQNLSILGFDSCVMSMFEVGQQFEGISNAMIASEGSIPNAGWSYSEILESIANQTGDEKEIAKEFVYKYINKQSQYAIGGVSVDMAAWDLTNLNELRNKFAGLAKSLLVCFENNKSSTYKQMRRILLQVHFSCQTYMLEQCIDLGDFCSLLIREIDSLNEEINDELNTSLKTLYDSCISVVEEIEDCIILSGFSGGEYQYSTGISLFFPWSLSAYEVSQFDYENLHFVSKTNAGKLWNRFLQKYLNEVSRRKTRTIFVGQNSIKVSKTNQTNCEITPF